MLYSLGLFMGKRAIVCEREYVVCVDCILCGMLCVKKQKNITYPLCSLRCHHKEHATLSTCH